ncbi:MAG TPA: hypothetical protein VLG11_02710 [Candidatus Saccharimonadales bacterium]|nr:hypothetical protein [Candidatus Saccharimonadales bacterium]
MDIVEAVQWATNPIAHTGVADLCADHAGLNIANFIFGTLSFKQLGFFSRRILAPLVFNAQVLKSIDLLIANDTVHVHQSHVASIKLVFEFAVEL